MARRSSQKRSLRPIVVIFTEGETEEKYFKQLNQRYHAKFPVLPISSGKQGSSLIIEADRALNNSRHLKLKNKKPEKVFVIFDKDDQTDKEIKEAQRLAEKYGYVIGFCNESFEVWLLLHYQRLTKSYDRKQLSNSLSSHLGQQYIKADDKQTAKIIDHLNDAFEHSEDVMKNSSFFDNPYTNLSEVIQEIYTL